MEVEVAIVVLPGAGDDDDPCPQLLQGSHCGIGGTTAAQHQDLFPADVQSALLHQIPEAEIVGVVPNQAPIPPADDGVHRPQPPGNRGELVQKGNHVFFIGNGHVQSHEISVFQESFQFFRLLFKQGIVVGSQLPVNLGRVAVPQLPAK